MNDTFLAGELEGDQVNSRRTKKESKNYASGGGKTGDGEVRYPCTNKGCERSYASKKGLQQHTRNECGKDPRYQCGYCDYKSCHVPNTRKHIVNVHHGCAYNILDISDGNRLHFPTRPATNHFCQNESNCLKPKDL
ncbi:hypothetical protein QAD02_022666 [Eretmocerus hayati]|uniref:Uncharacterized protein n=1 Tax=Eretmocerus hayati TaxID=131215 RepID=A0ACC2PTV8_9HYME|nr:hypothetical protein QAD02_022666 [Eretmocerus hayati]